VPIHVARRYHSQSLPTRIRRHTGRAGGHGAFRRVANLGNDLLYASLIY
jgi:hypothetical protein